jgi:hypothetical protein
MDSTIDISGIISKAADRFGAMLDIFRLGESENTGFPERNLSFQFSLAFLQDYPHGTVFQEVTFDKYEHLDTLLVADGYAIALECKVLIMKSRVADLASDAERLQQKVVPFMKERFKKTSALKWYTMLLCESWWDKHTDWWKGDKNTKSTWPRYEIFDKYERKSLLVRKDITFGKDGRRMWPLHWLYGYREYMDTDG